MKHKGVVLALAAFFALASVCVSQAQVRQAAGLTKGPTIHNPHAPAASTSHRTLHTYINTCLPSSCSAITLPANTFVTLDSVTTINCNAPVGHTCTVVLSAWLETVNNSSTGNDAGSISMIVDGTATPTFFGGDSPANAFYYDGLYNRGDVATGLSRGNHTVQTQARSIIGATGDAWSAVYTVYTP